MDKTLEDFDNRPGNDKVKDFSKLDEIGLKPQSKEAFLKNLPEKVIRDGKIVPIREEIAKRLERGGAVKSTSTDEKDDPLRHTIVYPSPLKARA